MGAEFETDRIYRLGNFLRALRSSAIRNGFIDIVISIRDARNLNLTLNCSV